MEYNKIFYLIFLVCSLSGLLISKLNNDLYKEHNQQQSAVDDKNNKKNKNQENEEKNEKESKIIETNNTVHIALNVDNNFIYPTLVFLTSLFENRKNTSIYDITILINNINKNFFDKINTLKDKYGEQYIKIHIINMKNDFEGVVTNSHISAASYYRIALPTILPNVDRIIYTDVDVINFKDLSEMYNLELKDNIYLKATLDKISLLSELKELGINSTKYFNAGITLMNLKAMRMNGVENKIRNFIYTHYLEHHDQTAMNAICYNNWEILPLKYAIICLSEYWHLFEFYKNQDKRYMYNEAELKEGFYDSTLLHYAGMFKPWDKNYYKYKKKGEYWWYYAKLSGYYEEILKNYGFDKNFVERQIRKIPKNGGLIKNNYKRQ